MINLLPPQEKSELLMEKNKKLIVVLGCLILISLVYLSLILSALKYYILENITYQKTILESNEKKYQTKDFMDIKTQIQKYNASLGKVSNFYSKEIYLSNAIEEITLIPRPDGVVFDSITLSKKPTDTKIKVTISGTSKTRDNLLLFKNNIESNKKMENINFPPNNWIKPSDISFYMTLEINPNKK